jgi:hypothetical protein
MATRDEVLRSETSKEEGMNLDQRIFYTLTAKPELTVSRVAKGLALLVSGLKEKGLMTDAEIDEFLLSLVR